MARGEPPPVDWTSMPPSCDPAALTHDGREAAVASGERARNPVGAAPAGVHLSFCIDKNRNAELSAAAPPRGWHSRVLRDGARELLDTRREETSKGSTSTSRPSRNPATVRPANSYCGSDGAGERRPLALPLAAGISCGRVRRRGDGARRADLRSLSRTTRGPRNIETRVQMIETFREPFDVGIALHAATTDGSRRRSGRVSVTRPSPCRRAASGNSSSRWRGATRSAGQNRDWTTKGAYRSATGDARRSVRVHHAPALV